MQALRTIDTPATALEPTTLVGFAKPGPRYTSYPPATEFGPDFDAAAAAAELEALAAGVEGRGISLYTHIPFCSQLCWYCGCNVKVTRDRDRGSSYLDTLIRELDLVAARLGRVAVDEISLGGGSPNFLRRADLVRLVAAIRTRFEVRPEAELGVELDPRDTGADQVEALAGAGFSRISVGVQDFDERVQAIIHRHQSVERTEALVEHARRVGFTTCNVDLVYGLPAQTPDSFERTLEAVFAIRPDRVALFGYAHLPALRPHQKLVERGHLPTTSERAELLALALRRFAEAGYVRIGMDHFALPEDSLARAARSERLGRNFQGYVVERGSAVVGVGASAISATGGAYWQNQVDVEAWSRAVIAGALPVARGVALEDDDRIRRDVITRLMCHARLSIPAIEERWGVDFADYFAAELETLASAELAPLVTLDRAAGRIAATEIGSVLIRNVCMVFDRYLAARPGRFSMSL